MENQRKKCSQYLTIPIRSYIALLATGSLKYFYHQYMEYLKLQYQGVSPQYMMQHIMLL